MATINISSIMPIMPGMIQGAAMKSPFHVMPVHAITELGAQYEPPDVAKYNTVSLDAFSRRGLNVEELRAIASLLPDGAYIAGGYVSSILAGRDVSSDIDIFFTDSGAFESTYKMLSGLHTEQSHWPLIGYATNVDIDKLYAKNIIRNVTFNAMGKKPIQLIKIVWFTNPQHVINSFDFTAVQFAVGNDCNVVFSPLGLLDLYTNKLQVHRVQYPLSSLRRLIKYTNKGFTADTATLTELVTNIKQANIIADPDIMDYGD